MGTHVELMAKKNGVYPELLRIQSSGIKILQNFFYNIVFINKIKIRKCLNIHLFSSALISYLEIFTEKKN